MTLYSYSWGSPPHPCPPSLVLLSFHLGHGAPCFEAQSHPPRYGTEFTPPFLGGSVFSGQASVLKASVSLASSWWFPWLSRFELRRKCYCRTGNGESHKSGHHFAGLILGNSKVFDGPIGVFVCLTSITYLHFSGPLSMNTRLWLTGGKWVTHPVLSLSSQLLLMLSIMV